MEEQNTNLPPQQPGSGVYPASGPVAQTPAPIPTPPHKPANHKRLIILGVAALITLLLLCVIALLLPKKKAVNKNALPEITKKYDSPVGLLPVFQTQDIRNGKFKLSASYVTGDSFTREGNFYVNSSGQVSFEMLPDEAKVNGLIKSLYGTTAFNETERAATRYFKYDFNALLDYNYLFDKVQTVGGFVPLIEAAKQDISKIPESSQRILKLGPLCDAALAGVKAKTGSNIQTTSLKFDRHRDGIKTFASVDHASLQEIDQTAISLLENCFDLTQASSVDYQALVDKLKEETTKSPEFLYWQDGAKSYLEVNVARNEEELRSNLRFELTALNSLNSQPNGQTAAFNERRNLFGLAYSLCRSEPVITSDKSYRFISEDTLYSFPLAKDTGYYCTTRVVPSQYTKAATLALSLSTGKTITVNGTDADNLRAFHDLRHLIERFKLDNKRYPNQAEFGNLVGNNLGDLSINMQATIKAKIVTYTNLPTNCTNNCDDYVLIYNFGQQAQLLRRAYEK